jgi:acyl carrier protein
MINKVIEILYSAIDDLNEQIEQPIEKNEATKLSDNLDSLNLINYIVSVEDLIQEKLDKTVVLSDEEIMDQKMNPFETIGTLAEYINNKMVKENV